MSKLVPVFLIASLIFPPTVFADTNHNTSLAAREPSLAAVSHGIAYVSRQLNTRGMKFSIDGDKRQYTLLQLMREKALENKIIKGSISNPATFGLNEPFGILIKVNPVRNENAESLKRINAWVAITDPTHSHVYSSQKVSYKVDNPNVERTSYSKSSTWDDRFAADKWRDVKGITRMWDAAIAVLGTLGSYYIIKSSAVRFVVGPGFGTATVAAGAILLAGLSVSASVLYIKEAVTGRCHLVSIFNFSECADWKSKSWTGT